MLHHSMKLHAVRIRMHRARQPLLKYALRPSLLLKADSGLQLLRLLQQKQLVAGLKVRYNVTRLRIKRVKQRFKPKLTRWVSI